MPLKIKPFKWIKGALLIPISRLWKKADVKTKLIVPAAVAIVDNLKKFLDSPVADVLTALIPGDLDDKIAAKAKEVIPQILTQLVVIESIANIEDMNEKLKAILDAIKPRTDDAKKVFYHGLCALIIEKLSDGEVSWSDAVVIAEYVHKNGLNQAE